MLASVQPSVMFILVVLFFAFATLSFTLLLLFLRPRQLLPFVGSGSGLIHVSLFIVATDKDIFLMLIKDTLLEPHALHDDCWEEGQTKI